MSKVQAETHVKPSVKYGCNCASFHKSQLFNKVLWGSLIQNFFF